MSWTATVFQIRKKGAELEVRVTCTPTDPVPVLGQTYELRELGAPTPVDCVVGPWTLESAGPWSACVNGQQSRTETWVRAIVTPPAHGGAACPPTTETRTATQACTPTTPVDCVVGAWTLQSAGPWSECVGGQQSRTETWTRPILTPPANGGAPCPPTTETRTATQACTTIPVPVGGLVQKEHMVYVGAFRLPTGFENAGQGSVFNPANQSLFITANGHRTAEIAIPTPSPSTNLADLPTAQYLQQPVDAYEGQLQTVGTDVQIGGYVLHEGQLVLDGFVYYDGSGSQRLSHWNRSTDLRAPGTLRGPYGIVMQPWNMTAPGLTSGPLGLIPPEWQYFFGGPCFATQQCIPILSRTSWGPSLMAWDPATYPGNTTPYPSLLYYTQDHMLANYEDPNGNDLFCGPTHMKGVVFVPGTRSILYFGSHGTGPFCYGDGTSQNPPPPGYCYDPVNSDKGNHTYPYHYQVWAYDANDLLDVKNGMKQHWEPRPYAWWRWDNLPFAQEYKELLGAAYDPLSRHFYITQQWGDGAKPVVYVFRLNT